MHQWRVYSVIKNNLCSKFKGKYSKNYSDRTLREIEKTIKEIGR